MASDLQESPLLEHPSNNPSGKVGHSLQILVKNKFYRDISSDVGSSKSRIAHYALRLVDRVLSVRRKDPHDLTGEQQDP